MNRYAILTTVAIALVSTAAAEAQVYRVYYPAPTAVYYQPAPAVTTAYYAPAPTTVYYAPAPVAVAPAPVVAAPAPVAVAPAPVVTTYYRPLVGGAITRVRYAPVPVVYPRTVAYYPAY